MPPHVAVPSGSPVYSSGGEDFDFEDEHNQAQWQGAPGATAEPLPQPTAPMQKRRRVTRACDECRRKKIKCDGKQPCTHCTVYSYDCTYDQPSNRRRNPAPQYIEALETRCQRLEQMLKAVLPDTDLNDPTIDAAIQQRRQAGNAKELLLSAPTSNLVSKASESPKSPQKDAQLRSMIASTGQLDLDESGNWDFHGGSSGTVFMKRMREQFGGLLGGGYGTPFLPKMSKRLPLPAYDSPKSFGAESPDSGHAHTMDLPPQDVAKTLCENALMDACALLRFVHLPTFWELFSRIYETPTDHFGDCENRFLPLLYLVLSVGCMFRRGPSDTESAADYRESIDEGLKYFRAGRGLMDITECRDLTSLQALLFMILFLQSSSNLSTCYSYIGVALRSALRMGLHRNLPGSFNPIERETRRRCFWIVRKMDTYVSALLGFPRMLSDDDIDQEFPIEVDDQYITKDAVLPMPPGKISVYTASNAHTRLMKILSKVLKYVYPLKGMEQSVSCSPNSSYVVSQASIHEIESDLAEWLGKLPMQLRPGGESSPEVVRVQQLLRLSYAHVQMMLYRPFLHYVSKSSVGTERSFACAAAGVSVSRNIVHITTEMKKRGLLIGAYWFTMYTTFFAILSLVYFVLNNPDKPGTQEILADALDGKEALAGLAKRSQAADRCTITLMGLFDQLPDRVKNPGHVAGTKKRSAPSQFPSETKPSVRSATELKLSEPAMAGAVSRAATFPGPKTAQTGLSFNQSIDNDLYLTNSASHPNLSQNFQDLMNPADMSAAGTPDSGSSGQQTQYPLQPGFNSGLSNLSATMFPSGDPFAYPDQPLMEFENIKQENLGNAQAPPMFLSNGGNEPQLYDDLEGQLFGPVPPYLMQNQNFDTTGQMNAGNDMMNGMNPQNMAFPTGMTPNNEMNLGDLFSSDDWAGLISNPKYR